ncbi:MAG: Gfo/Idh/MocA family oxidoreductase [Chloroflexales bacterium]|nr:Gfo/Idh/MocA family oxidoreductase [Chloroflexales bacterium]
MSVIRVGVVGAGSVAQRGILPHLSQPDLADRLALTAICDPAPGRAHAAAEKFSIPQQFTDYADFLDHAEVDVISLATPIGMHYAQGRAAILAGKHVHFNKTMTTTSAQATELIDLAAAQGVKIVASPGEMNRPHNQAIKQLIANGAIGELCWAVCGASFGRYHETEIYRQGNDPLSNVDPSWYYRKPGGGPMYDMTVYALHGLTGILGPAKRVTAMSGVRIPMREFRGQMVACDADDNTLVLIDFGNNVFAMAYGTPAGAVSEDDSGSFFGTKGQIVGLNLNGTAIDYAGSTIADSHPEGRWSGNQWILPHVTGSHRDIAEQHVFVDIMQLIAWIDGGPPPIASAQHARHVIEIIEAGFAAATTGQTQTLSTTF